MSGIHFGVYCASNLKHRHLWLKARSDGWPVISSWIDHPGHPTDLTEYADLWRACIAEASSAQVLLLYQEIGDSNKGALVEAGAALGAGVQVIYVGPNRGVLSFLYHPGVQHCGSLAEAFAVIAKSVK